MCVCVCVDVRVWCVWVGVYVYVSGKGSLYISMKLEEHTGFFLPHFVVKLILNTCCCKESARFVDHSLQL